MDSATIPFVDETWQLVKHHAGADAAVSFVAPHGPVHEIIATRPSTRAQASQSTVHESCHPPHSPLIESITPRSPFERSWASTSAANNAQENYHHQRMATPEASNEVQAAGAPVDHCLQSLTTTPLYGAQNLLPNSGLGPLPDVVMGLLDPNECGGQPFWPKEHTTLQCACLLRCFMLEITPYVSFQQVLDTVLCQAYIHLV